MHFLTWILDFLMTQHLSLWQWQRSFHPFFLISSVTLTEFNFIVLIILICRHWNCLREIRGSRKGLVSLLLLYSNDCRYLLKCWLNIAGPMWYVTDLWRSLDITVSVSQILDFEFTSFQSVIPKLGLCFSKANALALGALVVWVLFIFSTSCKHK